MKTIQRRERPRHAARKRAVRRSAIAKAPVTAFTELSLAASKMHGIRYTQEEKALLAHLKDVFSNRATLPNETDIWQYAEIVRLFLAEALDRRDYLDTNIVEFYHVLLRHGRKPNDWQSPTTLEEKLNDMFNETLVERSFLSNMPDRDRLPDEEDADALAQAGAKVSEQFGELYDVYRRECEQQSWRQRLALLQTPMRTTGTAAT